MIKFCRLKLKKIELCRQKFLSINLNSRYEFTWTLHFKVHVHEWHGSYIFAKRCHFNRKTHNFQNSAEATSMCCFLACVNTTLGKGKKYFFSLFFHRSLWHKTFKSFFPNVPHYNSRLIVTVPWDTNLHLQTLVQAEYKYYMSVCLTFSFHFPF